jgi:hypothetical protein
MENACHSNATNMLVTFCLQMCTTGSLLMVGQAASKQFSVWLHGLVQEEL